MIELNDTIKPEGKVIVTTRPAGSPPLVLDGGYEDFLKSLEAGKTEADRIYCNTVLTPWKSQLAKDIRDGLNQAKPRILAFSRDVVASSPEPTALTNEFRASCVAFADTNKMVAVAVLTPIIGNGVGNIKSCGFYFTSAATLTLATGTLGTIINTLNETKDNSMELTFQYVVTFS